MYRYTCSAKTPKSLALTYFDVSATPGEKLRLALKLANIPFQDNRVKYADWPALKPKTKYGQMPFIDADGEELYQSGSLLRWVGQMGNGLYPAGTVRHEMWNSVAVGSQRAASPLCALGRVACAEQDPVMCRKIEEMLGFADDLQRSWMPALYIGMGRHVSYGHPETFPDKDACVKKLREKFVADDLPKYMALLTAELEKTGAFVCGPKPTIADCQLSACRVSANPT